MNTQIRTQMRLTDFIQEYNAKMFGGDVSRSNSAGILEVVSSHIGIDAEIANFNRALAAVEAGSTVGNVYVGALFERTPHVSRTDMERRLLKSSWRSVYNGLNIERVATAKDRQKMQSLLESPPEFTLVNIREKFGDYLIDQRYHILRGLAEAFTDLDPAYKSHDKIKIGVKGLPKRVIIEAAMGEYSYGSYGDGKLKDMIRAFLTYRGEPDMTYQEYEGMKKEARRMGESDWAGGYVKAYANGNAHVIFNEEALLDINRALAEFYGDVLADSPEAKPEKKRQSTEVSKDLQFYWTPENVVKKMIEICEPQAGWKILEPSCGDGRIIDGIVSHVVKNRIEKVSILGVEYDAGRAAQARAKGYAVVAGNFLEYPSEEIYDAVYMNPPFYGKHYLKHIEKAITMLKPGGRLIALLPASAWYDHKMLPGMKYDDKKPYAGRDAWTDMPLGSFRETGTNVCTGIWRYWKPKVS